MEGVPKSKPEGSATVLIVIFVGLLWLPALDTFFHLDHARMSNENRAMAAFPRFRDLRHTGDFIAGLESYFNDHFGFRKRLIRWNNHWKHELFGSADGSGVIIGRNGWLFYNGDTVPEVTGQYRFSEKQLQSWQKLLETRRDWLARRGVKYLFVIAPDKHSVYPECLPQWLTPSPLPSKVDQFVNFMQSNSTVEVLSLRPALVAAKNIHPTYLTTDTHWNTFGGLVGYEALMEALSRQMPALRPLPLDDFEVRRGPGKTGDLAGMLGQESMPETQAWDAAPRPPRKRFKPDNAGRRLYKKTPKEVDGWVTFNPDAKYKALIFHDSFAGSWLSMLGQHFSEVDYIWRYDWDTVNFEREKPDVVIDEILERFFDSEDPVKLLREDGLH